MKKRLLIILVLVASILLVACSPDTETEDSDNEPIIENEEEPMGGRDDSDELDESIDEDTTSQDGFTFVVDNIEDFELEIELINDDEIDYDFDRSDNEAKVERDDGQELYLTGDEARDKVFELIDNIHISYDEPLNDMMDEVLEYLNISRDDIDDFEVEVEFLESKEIDFKYDRAENSENSQVKEFDLDIDFWDGSEWDFDYELNDEYEILGRENLNGQEARERIEELIAAMDVSMDSAIREIADNLFEHLTINLEDVEEFDLDIEYVDGKEIDVKVHY